MKKEKKIILTAVLIFLVYSVSANALIQNAGSTCTVGNTYTATLSLYMSSWKLYVVEGSYYISDCSALLSNNLGVKSCSGNNCQFLCPSPPSPLLGTVIKLVACDQYNDIIEESSGSLITASPLVNGQCGATQNNCAAGNFQDAADTTSFYKWNCLGINGGTTAYCSIAKPVSGQCGSTENACISGTFQDATDTVNLYKWNCLGSNGGTTIACSIAKPALIHNAGSACTLGNSYTA